MVLIKTSLKTFLLLFYFISDLDSKLKKCFLTAKINSTNRWILSMKLKESPFIIDRLCFRLIVMPNH